MRALLEAGIIPDLVIGTSIGAVNAVGVALWGPDLQGINALERAWKGAAGMRVMDSKIRWLILRTVLGRTSNRARKTVEHYFETIGISRNLRFGDIQRIRLALVSADIATGQPIIHGQDPQDLVLDGLLASIAVPPWFAPLRKGNRVMVDGGALSNLPIEPAMRLGATEIFALDLDDISLGPAEKYHFLDYIGAFVYSVSRRYVYLEKALAEARGVRVRTIEFRGLAPVSIWDFTRYGELIRAGYEKASADIAAWNRSEGGDFTRWKMIAKEWKSSRNSPTDRLTVVQETETQPDPDLARSGRS
jgi:NTE family protein